jgi:hypothetical protein
MAFNVTASPDPVADFVAAAGVESVLLKWTAAPYPVEIWRGDDNGPGILLTTTTTDSLVDGPLPAGVEVVYWVRMIRTLSTGDIVYSSLWSGGPMYGRCTPVAAEIPYGAVETDHLVANAVTTRATYTETSEEWVQKGTYSDGSVSPSGDWSWTLSDILFTGDDSTMVIDCWCRGVVSPKYFRMPDSSVWATVTAELVDITGGGTVVDSETLIVTGGRVEQQGIAGAYLTFDLDIHYQHKFILQTIAGRQYAIRFKLDAHVDDNSNFVLWATDLRQIVWQSFKR